MDSYSRRLSVKLNELLASHRGTFNRVMDGYTDIIAVTATYTASGSVSVILADPTGGAFTVMLPDPATVGGKSYVIKKVDAGGNAVTVDAVAGNLDGAATQSLSAAYSKIKLVSDGVNYWSI